MINHVRTLLLGLTATEQSPEPSDGSEYVPPEFLGLPLVTPAVAVLRRSLFGSRADVLGKMARTQQLLSLLHGRDLEDWIVSYDPRITYDHRRFRYLSATPYAQSTKPWCSVLLTDEVSRAGQLRRSWTVRVTSPTAIAVVDPNGGEQVLEDAFQGGNCILPVSDGVRIAVNDAGLGDGAAVVSTRQRHPELPYFAPISEELRSLFQQSGVPRPEDADSRHNAVRLRHAACGLVALTETARRDGRVR